LILTDILKALYQPQKVFKQIVQNPKYLGALIVFVIFVAAQTGFYYTLYSKTYYEQTSPDVNHLGAWTQNPGLWNATGVISSNSLDFINSTSSVYGSNSTQFDASNTNSISLALMNFGTVNQVNCGPTGYQNFSMRTKIVQPSTNPQKVTLTLYSLTDANYFQYDLTPNFSNASLLGSWENMTIQLGIGNWQSSGSPQWSNITALKLDFTFSANSNITLRMAGVFFRGIYQTPIQSDSTGFLIYVLQSVITQFLFEWLIITGILYVIVKLMKGNLTWKPLFVAVGIALIVSVVQTLLNIASTAALSSIYYPIEFLVAVPGEVQTIATAIASATGTYTTISAVIQLATYVWLGALNAIIVRAMIPEFTWSKAATASAAALIITILLLSILGV
jgi:hypothetical protein